MTLIGLLLAIAFLGSRRLTHKALPVESLVAFGAIGVTCVLLFQMGRLS